MQSSPSPAHPQLPVLQTQMVSDGMTGSNPVSPASSSSPASSGAGGISPQHIAQDSSLDGPPGPPDGTTVPLEGFSLSQAADLANKGPKWEKSHAEIAEQAKHEAEIETRIAELRKEGFWSLKRLPKVPECSGFLLTLLRSADGNEVWPGRYVLFALLSKFLQVCF
uniref:Snf2-related CREBBP activator protein n=1 Tax=Cricetulus griseus TaxID=10029 RepID=A0A8C2LTM7_CRIGR